MPIPASDTLAATCDRPSAAVTPSSPTARLDRDGIATARLHEWEREEERASQVDARALGPDRASVRLDDRPAEREPQPRSRPILHRRARIAVEAVEDALELIGGKPDPLIPDTHQYLAPTTTPHNLNRYLRARG